jgi:hypothetical protein
MQTDILLNLVPDDILNQTTGNGDYLLIADVEIFKKDQEKIRNQKRSIGKVVIK